MQTQTTPLQGLIDLFYFLALIAIIMLLTVAFQRTIYLQGQRRQSPIVLLRVGMHFFWRMLKFGLIYLPVYVFLAWLTFLTIKQLTSIETGFWETAKVEPVIYQLCYTTATLILIKISLLIFPLIVVLDCRISKSFILLKRCKLLDAKELITLFLISRMLMFLWVFLPSVNSATTILQYVVIVAWTIIPNFIVLMMAVMAVRFVASLNLVYDSGHVSSDSQGLLKHPIKD